MGYSKARPHNPDPDKYQVVQTQYGFYLKRKRGTIKPATINETFRQHAENTCSTEAKEVFRVLKPYIGKLFKQKQVYLAMRLKKAKLETGYPDYRYCERLEINHEHPLSDIYHGNFFISEKKGILYFEIPLGEHVVEKMNNLSTDYYFEAILITGDPVKAGSLRSESDRSELFSYDKTYSQKVKINLVLPQVDVPYLVILKIGCMEGKEEAHHPKHYGVMVVRTGVPERGNAL